ncbi:hypothetical protein F5X99DRAFT_11843 [Biscogniauxia marginata]|nr:hypothetical protein F5X99DRAFT_11843 [Biscogniauxia marginata]
MHSRHLLFSYIAPITLVPAIPALTLQLPVPVSPSVAIVDALPLPPPPPPLPLPPAAAAVAADMTPRREPPPISPDSLPCLLVDFPHTPANPPPCWAWVAPPTSAPSDYCGASTFAAVPSSSSSSVSSSSASWLSSCESLLLQVPDGGSSSSGSSSSSSSSGRDFFLASYAPDRFNTLLLVSGSEAEEEDAAVGCALQVRPARPPSDEQVYVGGADVADILGSAIGTARRAGVGGGIGGIEGSMVCGGDEVRWRLVPC